MNLFFCPICGGSIEPLRTGVAVFARLESEARNVGGLKAYRCQLYAHIFFVKTEDLELVEKFAP